MIRLQRIRAKGPFVKFEGVDFKFDAPLTVVQGLNLDSRSKDDPNGAGKTSLFSILPQVRYGKLPVATGKRRKKQTEDNDNYLQVDWTTGGVPWRARQGLSSSGSMRLELSEDQRPLRIKSIEDSFAELDRGFPINEDQFFSLVLLVPARSNILQYGSGTKRIALFEQLFRLKHYDYLHEQLKLKFEAAAKARIELETTRKLAAGITEPERTDDLRTQLDILDKTLFELGHRTNQNASERAAIQAWIDISAELEGYDPKDLPGQLDRLERRRRDLDAAQKAWAEYDSYQKSAEAHRELREELERIQPSKELDHYEKWAQRCRERLAEMKRRREDIETRRGFADMRGGSRCLMCDTKVPHDHWQELARNDEARLIETQDAIRTLTIDLGYYEDGIQRWGRMREIGKQLSWLPKAVSRPEVSLEEARRAYDKQQRLVDCYRADEKTHKALANLSVSYDFTEDALERLDELASDSVATTLASKIVARASAELRERIARSDNDSRILLELDRQTHKAGRLAADYALLKDLVEAYGPRGLRLDDIEEIIDLFVEGLNHHAPAVFAEPITFDAKLTGRDLTILYKTKESARPEDVIHLSYSESGCFSLLCLLALLPLIPSQSRCDTVILDEIERGMSDPNRRRLVEHAIPELMKVVPKVVLITPMNDVFDDIPGARKVTVVKEKGVARLLEAA